MSPDTPNSGQRKRVDATVASPSPNVGIVAAFSEDQAHALSGVTKAQLRYWERTNFFWPSYAEENRRAPFSRIYSFRDIVALRVLYSLRKVYGVPLAHLRDVSERLRHLEPNERWGSTRLWVLNKRVVWQEPGSARPQEVVSQQYVVPVVLETIIADTAEDIAKLRKRDPSNEGRIERSRFVAHNAPVLAGTRIPVRAIKNFALAGYDSARIIAEYPDLTEKDIEAALAYDLRAAA